MTQVLPGVVGKKKFKKFPRRDTLVRSYSKFFPHRGQSGLAKMYQFLPICTYSCQNVQFPRQNVQFPRQNVQIPHHGEENGIIIPRRVLLASKKSKISRLIRKISNCLSRTSFRLKEPASLMVAMRKLRESRRAQSIIDI